MQLTALIGASGSLGKAIASELSARSKLYRVIGRSETSLRSTFGHDPLAEVTLWNPDDPETVHTALQGVDTAIYMVGVNYWQFELHIRS